MALKTKYSPLQHLSLENLLTALGDLSPRNKVVAMAVAGAALVLVIFLPLSLVSGKIRSLNREIAAARHGYLQVLDKIDDYKRTQVEIAEMEKRFSQGGSLTGRIETIARDSGLTVDQLKEKAPQETDYLGINAVEVKLSNVNISQLVEFLSNLENDKAAPMSVRRIQIKPKFSNRQNLDVTCEVASFTLRKEA